jgi:predicted transposase YbfD/YdcC
LDFPGAQIALRVDRDVIAADGTVRSSDTRYFLTSLNPDRVTARELLAAVRAHWQIENSLFFIKDRWWDEDRHWTRRPGVAEWFTQLTTAAIIALRALGPPELPIRARADQVAWTPALGLAMLRAK